MDVLKAGTGTLFKI
jgi:hypothetical protein